MAVNYVPEGYRTVTPYLVVNDVHRLMQFLERAFGAQEVERMAGPDGAITHAAMRIGDSMVMMGQAQPGVEPTSTMICLYVPDADSAYRRALEAGATSVREVADQFYGDRSGGVKDPTGNQWWVSTHIEDVAPGELQRRAEAAMRKDQVGAK